MTLKHDFFTLIPCLFEYPTVILLSLCYIATITCQRMCLNRYILLLRKLAVCIIFM